MAETPIIEQLLVRVKDSESDRFFHLPFPTGKIPRPGDRIQINGFGDIVVTGVVWGRSTSPSSGYRTSDQNQIVAVPTGLVLECGDKYILSTEQHDNGSYRWVLEPLSPYSPTIEARKPILSGNP